jgi:hypothetical protein
MEGDGIVFVAAGQAYARAASKAAFSVRAHAPSLAIDLFTDAPQAAETIFDRVHLLNGSHRRSKVDCLHRTRFARTLYLDTDIRVVQDISDIFRVMDRFDIALAHAHARNRRETKAVWRIDLPDAFPQINTGVMLFKSSPAVLQLLLEWGQAYHSAGFKKDQVTLRELLWVSDLRLHILPPEYNVRYEKYLRVWSEQEAVPRILHFPAFHVQAPRQKRRWNDCKIWQGIRLPFGLKWCRRIVLL